MKYSRWVSPHSGRRAPRRRARLAPKLWLWTGRPVTLSNNTCNRLLQTINAQRGNERTSPRGRRAPVTRRETTAERCAKGDPPKTRQHQLRSTEWSGHAHTDQNQSEEQRGVVSLQRLKLHWDTSFAAAADDDVTVIVEKLWCHSGTPLTTPLLMEGRLRGTGFRFQRWPYADEARLRRRRLLPLSTTHPARMLPATSLFCNFIFSREMKVSSLKRDWAVHMTSGVSGWKSVRNSIHFHLYSYTEIHQIRFLLT